MFICTVFVEVSLLSPKTGLISWTASLPKDEEEKVQMKRKRQERRLS